MRKIDGSPAFAINPTYRDGVATPHGASTGWADISTLITPPTDNPVSAAPVANYPGRYALRAGSASTPGGQPLDFSPSIPVGGGVGMPAAGSSSGSGSGGGSADPITTVADAFMAALGSGGASATSGGAPTILYPSAQVDDSTGGGSSMNVKTIAIAAVIIVAAWYAWKKWGKPAASS